VTAVTCVTRVCRIGLELDAKRLKLNKLSLQATDVQYRLLYGLSNNHEEAQLR